jgi:hypothetical protein
MWHPHRQPNKITDSQVDDCDRGAGATSRSPRPYDAALFDLFVRLADAFDIHPRRPSTPPVSSGR